MPEPRNAFRLGLTLIAMFALFLAVLVFIAGNVQLGGTRITVRFPAEDLSARLKKGSEVVCGGLSVGTIRDTLLKDDPDGLAVYVVADISPVVGLQEGCEIIPGEPLLGEVGKLVIRNRGHGRPIDPGQPIQGRRGRSFNASLELLQDQLDPKNKDSLIALIRAQLDADNTASLLAKIHRSLDDLNAVTRNVSAQLNPRDQAALMAKLHVVLDNVNTATGRLRDQVDPQRREAALAKVHDALDSLNKALAGVVATLDETRPVVRDTLARVRNTAATLDEKIAPRIAEQLDARNADSLIAGAQTAVRLLNESLTDINRITGTGRQMITANKDMIGEIVSNLLQTSEMIKSGIRNILLNPWQLLAKPSPNELEKRNIVDVARAFSDAAAQLDNAALRLKAVADAGQVRADDPVLSEVRDAIQHSLEQFTRAEEALWRQLNLR